MADNLEVCMRILTMLSRKENAMRNCGDFIEANAMHTARMEVQNLMTTELGFSHQQVQQAANQKVGKYPCRTN